jgi:hypothetical protein
VNAVLIPKSFGDELSLIGMFAHGEISAEGSFFWFNAEVPTNEFPVWSSFSGVSDEDLDLIFSLAPSGMPVFAQPAKENSK